MREPETRSGHWPVVMVGPATVRARVQPLQGKPTPTWIMGAIEALGAAAVDSVDASAPETRVNQLVDRLEALPECDAVYDALAQACAVAGEAQRDAESRRRTKPAEPHAPADDSDDDDSDNDDEDDARKPAPRPRSPRRPRRPDARRRQRGAWATLAIVLSLIVLVALDRSGALLAPTDDARLYHGAAAIVERVVDGDTLLVAIPDPRNPDRSTTRVRLWGIDAPELARDSRPAQPFASDAADRLRALVEGREGTLRPEPSRTRDRYGRLLAHVTVTTDDNDEFVAVVLLREGLARAEPRWPHSHSERFEGVETEARRAARGLWSKGSPSGR